MKKQDLKKIIKHIVRESLNRLPPDSFSQEPSWESDEDKKEMLIKKLEELEHQLAYGTGDDLDAVMNRIQQVSNELSKLEGIPHDEDNDIDPPDHNVDPRNN
jgi:hypothetical protein